MELQGSLERAASDLDGDFDNLQDGTLPSRSRNRQFGLRIAIVELHDATNENVGFLENVATNRGGPIQFFDNEQHAKDWLGIS